MFKYLLLQQKLEETPKRVQFTENTQNGGRYRMKDGRKQKTDRVRKCRVGVGGGWGGEGEVFPHVAAVAWNSARLEMMHSHFSIKIAAAFIYLVGGFHPVSRSQDHCGCPITENTVTWSNSVTITFTQKNPTTGVPQAQMSPCTGGLMISNPSSLQPYYTLKWPYVASPSLWTSEASGTLTFNPLTLLFKFG